MTDHEAVQAAAAELALGVLSGPERADALVHLASCAECRARVEQLLDVADRLLLVAPEVEPPAGFETAVLDRAVGSSARGRRPGRVWAIAAAVAFLLGGAVGAFVGRDRSTSRLDREYVAALRELDGRALAAATLVDRAGVRKGQAFLYQGAVSWIFVTVADPGADGEYRAELDYEDGRTERVPGLVLRDGAGSLGATVDLRLRDLALIRVVDGAGTTQYRGTRIR